MSTKVSTALAELRRELEALYGERLVRLVLFGSQARADAGSDSDIDVLVVLKGPVHSGVEVERGSHVTSPVSLKHDVVISCVYVSEERYNSDRGPLLANVRAEGVSV